MRIRLRPALADNTVPPKKFVPHDIIADRIRHENPALYARLMEFAMSTAAP